MLFDCCFDRAEQINTVGGGSDTLGSTQGSMTLIEPPRKKRLLDPQHERQARGDEEPVCLAHEDHDECDDHPEIQEGEAVTLLRSACSALEMDELKIVASGQYELIGTHASQADYEAGNATGYGKIYMRNPQPGEKTKCMSFYMEGSCACPPHFLRYIMTEHNIIDGCIEEEKVEKGRFLLNNDLGKELHLNMDPCPLRDEAMFSVQTFVQREIYEIGSPFNNREAVTFNVHAELDDETFLMLSKKCAHPKWPKRPNPTRMRKELYIAISPASSQGHSTYRIHMCGNPKMSIPSFLLKMAYVTGLDFWNDRLPDYAKRNINNTELNHLYNAPYYPTELFLDGLEVVN